MPFVYQPGIPTGIVDLDQDYLNVQGNFQQLNIVYGTDHYPFDNATPNQGFHNLVTTPIFVDSPPTGLPPVTTTNPKFYAFQQYTALGILQYSRGATTPVDNSVPTPLTHKNSSATATTIGAGATINVLDFTGMALAFCTLYATDTVVPQIGAAVVIWTGTTLFVKPIFAGSINLVLQATGNILQIKNSGPNPFNNVYWDLVIDRVQ